MKINRILLTACFALTLIGSASAVTITTLDGSQGWYLADVRPGGTAEIVDLTGLGGDLENNQPLPTGAVKLTTNMTNDAKAEIGIGGDFGLASAVLNDIALGYNYYKQNVSGGNAFAAPSIKLTLYAAGGTGDNFGTLVYEPYWNAPYNNSAVTTDAWQSVSIDSSTGSGADAVGGWTWNGGFEIGSGYGGPPVRSLAEWVTAFQASDATDFANAHIVGLSMGVGSYNQGQIDYFDNVSIQSTAGNIDTVYDFQVPEPATLALLGLGVLALRKRKM